MRDPDTILRQEIVDRELLAVAMFDRYYVTLHFLAYSIIGNPDSADDAVQEAIICALDKIDSYRTGSNMKAWLSTIAVNQCRNMLRRKRAQQRLAKGLFLLFGSKQPQNSVEDQTLGKEAESELWKSVDKLGEKYGLPIILRYVHNFSIREISQILDTREGTIHSRLHRACSQLRRQLAVSDNDELIREYLHE